MDDISKFLEKLDSLNRSFGIIGAIIGLVLLLSIFFLFKYLTKKIETQVENSFDKLTRKFQAQLDKELQEFSIRFSTLHKSQTEAIKEVYKKFFLLTDFFSHMVNGSKYEEQLYPKEEIQMLIDSRRDLLKVYGINKIYISKGICNKIDNVVIALDKFIDTYESGLNPNNSYSSLQSSNNLEELFEIAGIWNQKNFTEVVKEFQSIQNELEDAFRKANET